MKKIYIGSFCPNCQQRAHRIEVNVLKLGSYCHNCWVRNSGDFPGSLVVKIPCFHCRGHRTGPLVGELEPTMPFSMAKKKNSGVMQLATLSIYTSDRSCRECIFPVNSVSHSKLEQMKDLWNLSFRLVFCFPVFAVY